MKKITFNIVAMKQFLLSLFLVLFSNLSYAQVSTFDCSNGQCVLSCGPLNPTCTGTVFNINPSPISCASNSYNCVSGDFYTSVSSSAKNTEAINITSDLVLKPQNIKISVENGVAPGQDLTVNLNAKSPQWTNAASFILISDNINQANINVSGYSGKKGKDASEICADKMKNGDYGSGAQTFFNTRRASNSSIDVNRCDLQDLNYMQQFSFTCDDPSFAEISVSNPVVNVQRIKSKARCSAVGSYNDCVQKKVRVNCNYQLWSTIKNRALTADDAANQSWVGTYTSSTNYTGTGEYINLGSSTSYQLCGSGTYQYCNSANGQSMYPGSTNICSSGLVPYSSIFTNFSSSDQAACNLVQYTSSTNTVSYYKQVNNINQVKRTLFPLNKTGVQVGPFDESFFINESNRLGGIGGFCQQYGFSASVATDPVAWLGGTNSYPASQVALQLCNYYIPPPPSCSGFFCFGSSVVKTCGSSVDGATSSTPLNQYAYYDNGGIPFEFTSQSTNVNWQSDTTAQHSLSCVGSGSSQACRAAIWKATTGSTFTYTTEQAIGMGCFSPAVPPATVGTYLNLSQANCTSPNTWMSGPIPSNDNWNRLQSATFEACPANYTVDKTNYITLIQYANDSSQCSSVTDPLDPNNRATWQYTGMAQEVSFGTETVSCGIGACAVNSSVSDLDRNVDVITPGSGEDGTEQGRGLMFVYDIKQLTSNALAGSAGSKGAPDLTINPQVRICAKIDDATAGVNEPQAKNPFVSFRRYNWQSIRANNAGNNGVPPRQNGKKVEVFKKLDPATRYLLEKCLDSNSTSCGG